MTRWIPVLLAIPLLGAAQDPRPLDFGAMERRPAAFKGVQFADGKATLSSDRWGFLVAPDEYADVEIETTFTIQEPAKQFRFFGESWSVWPDLTYPDQGFEAAILLRSGPESGYRVQFSHRLQEVALVKYPDGGYLRSAPCAIRLNESHTVTVSARSNRISVRVGGQEKISFADTLLSIPKGRLGVGSSSGAKVAFEKLTVRNLEPGPAQAPAPHAPDFRVRTWLGGRPWVFDGDEPILMLVSEKESYINNVKLRPGFKPLLSWNSYWETSNQGAFPEGAAKPGDATVTGGGTSLTAAWTAKGLKDRFVQRIQMVVGWDPKRSTYTYDVESELEVLPGDPFHFRYGFDFEHHTPLDPFRWQYLIVRREGGQIAHRPVYPVDPGPIDKVEQSGGARVWYGRHNEPMVVAPAVEYDLPEAGKRKLGTAVCAAFYDTGVAFEAETAKPGSKIRAKYRYTGYPAPEAEALFRASKIYDSPMLDPLHHYIFADEWPKLTFSKFVPMSETWIYGRHPFMTAHNQRPSYELAKDAGVGSGFAMKLGPGAFGAAELPIPSPFPAGRYAVTALAKGVNVHGPGGRIEVTAKDKGGRELRRETHYLGNGTWDWRKTAFATEFPEGVHSLAVGFGNAGTGEVWVTEVEFARTDDAALGRPHGEPAPFEAAPAGSLFDYRMEEGRGLHVLDYARGPFGMLELANADWVVDGGRPALRFADPAPGRHDVPRLGSIERNYLKTISWSGTPVAIAGHHGGGFDLKAFTLSTSIKPDGQMGKAQHGGKGDIAGLGARRFILRLAGQEAPYHLEAAVNVNDRFVSDAKIDAGRWTSVAMTGEPTEAKKWRIRLYVDGQRVLEGVTQKFDAPASIPPSLILGSEIFYLHDAWYRGLIGRTTLLDRALSDAEMAPRK
jgi:hypothetical protein